MGNTSTNNDKTAADEAKVKLIIGEIGRDTQTGIIGRGYSFDNGRTFHVTDTIYGRLYDDRDVDGVWNNGMHEKVKEKVNQEITNTVEPAIKQADSAVAYANDAIEKSRVNSQAIVDINSAVSDAVSDAAVARSDGLRAWDAAQSNADLIDLNYASASVAISSARTEAIAAADEAKASASAAQADIVAVQSDVAAVQADVTATRSDVATAKSDIAKAKSDATAGINAVRSDVATAKSDIADTKTSLTSQAKSLSSYAAQASAAGKDITTLKSQAGQLEQDMADTKGDVSQLKVSASSASVALSDAAGNISSLQATAKSYSAALSDTNSNVASVTATASELETKYADAAGDIDQIKTTAKGTAETIANAQGDIASLKKRADGFDTQFANTNGDINKLQTDATGTKQTLTNAKSDIAVLQSRADGFDVKYANTAGDISQLQADAKGTAQTLADAQGDIAKLKIRADGFDTQFSSTNGDISKLQTDASGTRQTLTNAKSDIAVLQSRADGFDTKYANAAGDINTLKVDAKGFNQTLTNAKGDISTLQATATGFKNTLTDAQGNISTLQSDVSGLKKTTSDHAGNIATLQADAKTLTSQMSSAQGDISTLKQTASGFSSKVSGMETSLANTMQNRGTVNLPDFNSLTQAGYYTITNPIYGKNYPTGSWGTLEVSGQVTDINGRLNQKYVSDNNGMTYTRQYNANTKGWTAWVKVANQNDIDTLNGKITTNATAIEQNKKAITLKADQTEVDQVKQTVTQNSSRLDVMANEISSKVTSTDVNNIINGKGYATTSTVQSLITQKAGTISESIVKLDQTVKQGAENNVQLVRKSDFEDDDKGGWSVQAVVATDPPAELGQSGMKVLQTNVRDDYEDGIWYSVKPGEKFDVDFWCKPSTAYPSNLGLAFTDKDHTNWNWQGIVTDQSGQWKHYTGTITAPANASFAKPWFQMDKDASNTTDTALLAKPSIRRQNATTVAAIQQITASIDGLQSNVKNFKNDTSSQITQLSDVVQSKVSQGDYNSQIIQLKDDINLRVAKGNVVSQINQEAGGNTLIQVSNGKGKLALNASSVIFSGSAFIPDAYISTLNADKLRFYDSSGNVATMSAGLEQYDDDKTKHTVTLQYSGGYEVHASNLLGSILTMHDNTIRLAVKANGMASSGNVDQYSGVYVMQHYAQLSNYRSNGSAPGIYITDDGYTIKGDSTGSGTKWGDLNITSPQIYVTGGNSVSLSGSNAVQMQVNKTHAWLSDGMLHLYKDGDSSSTATELRVEGWAWVNGWVEAAGHSQHSALSTKTDIQSVDDDKMLEMVNNTDLTTFLFTSDVANGETHRHIGLIIDDVHDVAQYQTPQEFIAPNGVSRDDDNMIGALFGAVKALTKRIKTLESKVG